jgi:Zn finger protein HypA/HybF involved in hydrogenase expression
MHEMSLASSILETVQSEQTKNAGAHVTKVGLRIGEWSGVDTESLRFCLEALVTGTPLAPLEVDIDFRPASPHLDIAYLELEDA